MGNLKSTENNEENSSNGVGAFLSFILLDENKIDFKLLKKQLHDDWKIEIDTDSISDDNQSLIQEVGVMKIIVSLMPAPIPNDEVVRNAETNFRWEEAVNVAKAHKAHLIVTVMGGKDDLLTATDLYVKLCSTCLKQPNAIGINTLGSVLEPRFYIDFAEENIKNGDFPIMNMVFFGVFSDNEGATMNAYTYGLGVYGKKNIEVVNSDKPVNEILDILCSIAEYTITSDVTLEDGETIGLSEDQKLTITSSMSNILDEETLKIGL